MIRGWYMIRWWKTCVWPRVRQTVQGWYDDDGALLAAAMAYYALLSLFPLLLILLAVAGLVLHYSSGAQDAQQQLIALVAQNTTAGLAHSLEVVLAEVRVKAMVGGPLGLAALLLAAVGVFARLEQAFNRIWKVERRETKGILAALRNVFFHRLRAFAMLLAVGLLLVAALVAGMANSAVRSLAEDLPHGATLWHGIETLLSLALSWLLFTLIYKVLPRASVGWGEAAQGAGVAAALWEINRQALAALVIAERYSVYGIVGSIIVLLLWVYLASSILFLGAEYVQTVGRARPQE